MDIQKALEILGLKPDATFDEAKRAYKTQVKIWHPDRFSEDSILKPRAEENIRRINTAYAQVRSYLIFKEKRLFRQKVWPWVQPAADKPTRNRLKTVTTFFLKARSYIQNGLARLHLPDCVRRGVGFIVEAGQSSLHWGTERLARFRKGPWNKARRVVQTLVGDTVPRLFHSMKQGTCLVVKRGQALLYRWTEAFGEDARGAGEKEKDPFRTAKKPADWTPSGERPRDVQEKRRSPVKRMDQGRARRLARDGSAIKGIGDVGGPERVGRPSRVRRVDRI